MDDFSDKKERLSDFNEAGYQIARLNYLWNDCNNNSSSGKLNAYKWNLDRIWVELSADASEKDEEYYFPAIQVYNNAISKAKSNSTLYKMLEKKEIFLRKLQESVGKGGKKSDQGGEDW